MTGEGLHCCLIDPNLYFLPPARRGLRGHPYKVLQGASHCRRRGSAFSVRVMKYWNKSPVSVVTAPSANIFKKSLAKLWTDVFPHFPHWLNTHLPISLLHPHPTCTPPTNCYHLYMLPSSLFYICGFFRPVFTLINHNHPEQVKIRSRLSQLFRLVLAHQHVWLNDHPSRGSNPEHSACMRMLYLCASFARNKNELSIWWIVATLRLRSGSADHCQHCIVCILIEEKIAESESPV